MRIFVYEHLTALGIGADPASADHGMYREGRAMRDAVADDFRRLGWEVADTAAGSEWAVVIAPETGHILEKTVAGVIEAGGRPLNCSLPAIRLTADKLALADHWVRCEVPTPHTLRAVQWMPDDVPVVLKPRDGAGSTATFLLAEPTDLFPYLAEIELAGSTALAQRHVPGTPASVAFLVGPRETVPLLPGTQRLSADGRFHYLGGEIPLPPALAERAVALGRRAIDCVPGLLGYVGVDLVLGDAADGLADYAIEINPRLTTSYVGLRALADFNLAEAIVKLAAGEPPPAVRWKPGRVRFDPGGAVEWL